MKSLVALLLACWCAHLCSATPAIATTFYSKVSVVMKQGDYFVGPTWSGGGVFAVDMLGGIARTDILLLGNQGQENVLFHTLDRYDMEATYTIDDTLKCTTNTVKGAPANPWSWVAKSKLTGKSSYMGYSLETWEYTDPAQIRMKISVKSGTNEPMFFSTRHLSNTSIISEWVMTFMEWTEEKMPSWMTYIPSSCKSPEAVNPTNGDVNAVVYFANKNWNCADPSCSQTVPSGSPQPGYECAEFVARSLAAGGYIPGLTSSSPQSAYSGYVYKGGRYNLCITSNLSNALGAIGFTKLPTAYSSVTAGVAAFGDGGDGYFSHAVIGVSPGMVDQHNIARLDRPVTDELFDGIDACWGVPAK